MRRAFTLLELVIAVGLGSVVLLGAATALRAASATAAVANRLSVENALMRGGWSAVHEELDWWTAYDDPLDAAAQPLRAAAGGQGLPFTPMDALAPRVDDADPERDRGWDGDDPWAVSDPRTWWRGIQPERQYSDLRHGRYAIFANRDEPALVAADATGGGAYGTVTPPHPWLPNQIDLLVNGLGYYAGCEYLPPNQIYQYCQSYADGVTTNGGILRDMVVPGGRFANTDPGITGFCRGLYLQTFMTAYAVIAPAGGDASALADQHRRYYEIGWGASAGSTADFEGRTSARVPLMVLRPQHWPAVSATVAHYVKDAHFLALCAIRWVSPITGDSAQMSFASLGTSLRGARQQRRRDGGWCRWDNAAGAIRADLPTLDQ